jgi:phospholipase B1
MNMLTAAGGLLFLVLLADVHTAHVNSAGAPKPLKKTSSSSDSTPNLDHAEFLGQWRQKVHDIRRSDTKLIDFSYLYNVDFLATFNCVPQPPSSPVPTSVHALRPSDIRVVGALGDSITAGNGVRANNLAQVAFTNRGESWSIGGEKSLELRVLTFPNILRKFRPDLTGDSICRRSANDKPWSSLNVAVAGDTNRGMKAQAENVMLKMLENPDIDYYNDWKVITIFIGGNDLCRHCLNDASYGPEAYYQGIKDALDLFYNHLPRALINVQPMFDISIIHQANHSSSPLQCKALHRLDCPCAVGPDAKKRHRASRSADGVFR